MMFLHHNVALVSTLVSLTLFTVALRIQVLAPNFRPSSIAARIYGDSNPAVHKPVLPRAWSNKFDVPLVDTANSKEQGAVLVPATDSGSVVGPRSESGTNINSFIMNKFGKQDGEGKDRGKKGGKDGKSRGDDKDKGDDKDEDDDKDDD